MRASMKRSLHRKKEHSRQAKKRDAALDAEDELDDARVLVVVPEDAEQLPVIGIEERIEAEEEDDGQPPRVTQRFGVEAGDLLDLLVFPVPRERFFAEFWEQRALVVRSGGKPRLDNGIMEDYLLGLDCEQLVHASPSEQIHVWLASRDGLPSQSFRAEADVALQIYRTGACSLYFRAPQSLIDSLITGLAFALGAHFGGWAADGSLQGEIETFVSRPGNVTQFHLDFQENFTFQLSGSKKWTLRRSGLTAPLRGVTPHFSNMSQKVQDQQLCAARMDAGTQQWSFVECMEAEEETTVTLNAGDVFYHPSGLLHRVECVGDQESVSINCSLDFVRYSDYLADAANAAARREASLRRHPVQGYNRDVLAEKLRIFQEAVAGLTVDMVFPPGLWRRLPNPDTVFDVIHEARDLDLAGKKIRKNPLATTLEGHEDEDGATVFRFSFNCGGADLDSWLQTEFALEAEDDVEALSNLASMLDSTDEAVPVYPGTLSEPVRNALALMLERGVILLQ